MIETLACARGSEVREGEIDPEVLARYRAATARER
jgi:hypothetical protein